MKKPRWKPFPHDQAPYDYDGAALRKNWPRLHQGDCEPYPDVDWVKKALAASPAAKKSCGKLAADPDALAEALQQAWRLYHRGDFKEAHDQGMKLGLLGYTVANKAAGMQATYLEPDGEASLALFQSAAERAAELGEALPAHANGHYLAAYCLGRYSQGISVLKALAQGLGGKVKEALDATLQLAPKHAEAHSALGTWHAEIIDKVGGLMGGMTYGAGKDKALAHYRKALDLHPKSAIARVEYARGLLMLQPSKEAEARKLLQEAGRLKPADAMEKLDGELAKARLEEI